MGVPEQVAILEALYLSILGLFCPLSHDDLPIEVGHQAPAALCLTALVLLVRILLRFFEKGVFLQQFATGDVPVSDRPTLALGQFVHAPVVDQWPQVWAVA